MFYLTTHSTHFIYGYMASDIWLRTILTVRKETRCRHMGYSYRLGTGKRYLRVYIHLRFRHARSRAQPLAWPVTVRSRGYYRLAARVLLYAPSHRKDNTYHGLCSTSRGALAGTRNSYRSRISNHWATIPACSAVPPIYKQSKKTYCHVSF